MSVSEIEKIEPDTLEAKLAAAGVAPLDNNFVSNMLAKPPVCDFKSIFGDTPNNQEILLLALKEQLPEPSQNNDDAAPIQNNVAPSISRLPDIQGP